MPIPEPQHRYCADAYLADLAPFFGQIYGIATPLALYRRHGENYYHSGRQSTEAQLKIYEDRVESLNKSLVHFGIDIQVSLDNHLPYQRVLAEAGRGKSTVALTRLALSYPAEPSRLRRLRWASGVWKAALRRSLIP